MTKDIQTPTLSEIDELLKQTLEYQEATKDMPRYVLVKNQQCLEYAQIRHNKESK